MAPENMAMENPAMANPARERPALERVAAEFAQAESAPPENNSPDNLAMGKVAARGAAISPKPSVFPSASDSPSAPSSGKKVSLWRRLARLLAVFASGSALALAFLLALVSPPDPRDFPVSPVVLDAGGTPIYAGLTPQDEWLMPERLSDMGKWLPMVAVGIEDRRFRLHAGVDPLALARAMFQNLRHGRVVSGASTITVQLVRLSRPRPRTLYSKAVEFLEAIRLDLAFSKNEILELYLNRAPFGGNLRGVGAASRAYFGKAPDELSLGESATLVALLRGPSVYRPDRNPSLAKARRDFVLDLIFARGLVSEEEVRSAKSEDVKPSKYKPPRGAPHLSARILAGESPERWSWGADGFRGVPTTLEPARQRFLEEALALALEDFPEEVTGAGLIMDNKTGAVSAYVGGAREGGEARYVDHGLARRSSGSTLKPFVYLAACAESGLNPSSMLADTPLALDGEAPRNFDGGYRGPVSAGKALADSLNAPAVRVLRLAGFQASARVLGKAGIRLRSDRDYGDSLVLGGAETSLVELAEAYGTLARGGYKVVPSYFPAKDQSGRGPNASPDLAGSPVVSSGPDSALEPSLEPALDPAASFLVNLSLIDKGRLPPGLPPSSAAFKTGTSHGFRDAWMIAWTPDYTVALWLGDPTGKGHGGLSGLSALGAPAVAALSILGPPSPWPGPPAGLERFRACPLSGEPASPDCPGFVWAFRLSRDRRTIPCGLHVRSGSAVVLRWPKELEGFMAGQVKGQAKAGSSRGLKAQAPRVASPADGTVFRLAPGMERIPLKSEGAQGVVHWFLDSEHVATSRPGTVPLLTLSEGEHTLAMIDGRGSMAASSFSVLPMETARPQVLVLK